MVAIKHTGTYDRVSIIPVYFNKNQPYIKFFIKIIPSMIYRGAYGRSLSVDNNNINKHDCMTVIIIQYLGDHHNMSISAALV